VKERFESAPPNLEELAIAHIDDLLAKMTCPRRPKDVARVAALRAIQRRS